MLKRRFLPPYFLILTGLVITFSLLISPSLVTQSAPSKVGDPPVCLPDFQNNGESLSGWIQTPGGVVLSDGDNTAALNLPAGTSLAIHAIGSAQGYCQFKMCGDPECYNCIDNPLGRYERTVNSIHVNVNISSGYANANGWNYLGAIYGKNPQSGTSWDYHVLNSTDLNTSTGPRPHMPGPAGVYEYRITGNINTTPCNLNPAAFQPVEFTLIHDVEIDYGCQSCTGGAAGGGKDGGKSGNSGGAGAPTGVGEPVSVITGNMYLDQTDYVSNAPGAGIQLIRAYNSRRYASGIFGQGWTSTYEIKLQNLNNSYFRLVWGDGSVSYFKLDTATGKYMSMFRRGQFAYATKETDGTYKVFLKGGLIYKFSTTGLLTAILDRNNNQTTLTYNANNLVTTVTDAAGHTLNFTYTGGTSGYVQSISDNTGTIATYTYWSAADQLTVVTYADGSKYQFGIGVVANRFVVSQVRDADNNVLEQHAYDSSMRATTSELNGGVEKYTLSYVNDNETHVTDALGRVTKYFFNRKKAPAVVTSIEGVCACGGGGGNQTQSWTYNKWGEVLTYTDANGLVTTYTYDQYGNPATRTDATGTVAWQYNELADMLSTTDQMTGVTTYSRDVNGNLNSVTDAASGVVSFGTRNAQGLPPTITDRRGNVTQFTYYTNGLLQKRTDALTNETQYEYSARGWPTKVTDAAGNITTFTYDQVGRLKTVTEPGNAVTTYTYDIDGRLTRITDPRGYQTNYTYDGAYRLLTEKDALNQTTSYQYDLMSNLTKVTDALGRATDLEYDDFNRLKKITYPPATSGSTRATELFEYDTGGRLNKHTDQAGYQTLYEYDTANRLKKITDAKTGVTEFAYNARSQRLSVTDAKGQLYGFTYDPLGRVLTTTRGGTTMMYGYTNGARTSRTDYNGAQTSYAYNALNRLTTITYPGGGTATYGYDALSRLTTATNVNGTVSLGYDARHRVTSTGDVWSQAVNYSYDASNNRTAMTFPNYVVNYGYDAANRLTSVAHNLIGTATFGYDAVNRLRTRALPNGINTTANYDDLDRLTSLSYTKAGLTLPSFQYGYNTRNQITSLTDGAGTHTFAYDELQRLTAATHPNLPAESYTYDQVGNRTASQFSGSYSYQTPNRVTQIGGTAYTYDANGNLKTKSDGSGTTQYFYDHENRLTSVILPSTTVINYKYDALSRRVERSKSDGTWTRYSYDGLEVLRDVNSDGSTVEYVNGGELDDHLWQRKSDGTTQYFLTDHQGSTRALADATGAVTASYNYDAFGNGFSGTATRFGYTGREHDADTGLLYYRARWYDPGQGRFVSEDPIGLDGGINLYAYVENSPLNWVDPLGDFPRLPSGWWSRIGEKGLGKLALLNYVTTRIIGLPYQVRKLIQTPISEWFRKASRCHHDFRQKYRPEFERMGIDIDHPALTRWVEEGLHSNSKWGWHRRFNDLWDDFFKFYREVLKREPTKKEAIDLFKNKIRNVKGKDGKGYADSTDFPSYPPAC
jgi:RHS repeat-associated protein